MENPKESFVLKERLVSIDALRGFTMFWIIGGDKIMRSLPRVSDNIVFEFLERQLCHSEGAPIITFYDIIFPLFLFTIGFSSFISYKKKLGRGESKINLHKSIFERAALMFIMGLIYNVALGSGITTSFSGVLQYLAFGYLFSSLIMINTQVRGTAIWAGGILIFYILMKYIPVPGNEMGDGVHGGDFPNYISKLVLSFLGDKWHGVFSLSRLPGVTTALLGVLSGYWMISENSPIEKVKGFVISGAALVIAGLILSLLVPDQ